MNDLPQTAVEHLYPFLALAAVVGAGLWAVVRAVLKAISASDARTESIIKTVIGSQAHREMIVAGSVEALRTREGREELRFAAAEALHGLAEPITTTQNEQARQIKDIKADLTEARRAHGKRLGDLETWQARVEAPIAQVEEHTRKINALERGWIVAVGILKRAKLTDSEETGT